LKRSTGCNIDVSRLFIYYNGRVKDNESGEKITDSGVTTTSAIEALEEFGTCLESIWPYDVKRVNKRPDDDAYEAAEDHKISEALKVNIDLHEMKSCLAQGFPFVFGLELYKSFDKAEKKGIVPMPKPGDKNRESHGRCGFDLY
jgi:C1A family cysteine protease